MIGFFLACGFIYLLLYIIGVGICCLVFTIKQFIEGFIEMIELLKQGKWK